VDEDGPATSVMSGLARKVCVVERACERKMVVGGGGTRGGRERERDEGDKEDEGCRMSCWMTKSCKVEWIPLLDDQMSSSGRVGWQIPSSIGSEKTLEGKRPSPQTLIQ